MAFNLHWCFATRDHLNSRTRCIASLQKNSTRRDGIHAVRRPFTTPLRKSPISRPSIDWYKHPHNNDYFRRDGIMKFEKLGRRKNPHPNPPPQAMEGTNQGKYSVFNYQSTLCRPYEIESILGMKFHLITPSRRDATYRVHIANNFQVLSYPHLINTL